MQTLEDLSVSKEACKRPGEEFFTKAGSDMMMGNSLKLKEDKFALDTRKKCFTMQVFKNWKRFPTQVGTLIPGQLKTRLDKALSSLVS